MGIRDPRGRGRNYGQPAGDSSREAATRPIRPGRQLSPPNTQTTSWRCCSIPLAAELPPIEMESLAGSSVGLRPRRRTPTRAAGTRSVFGDYISIDDIARAVKDGATVPIQCEGWLLASRSRLSAMRAAMPRNRLE